MRPPAISPAEWMSALKHVPAKWPRFAGKNMRQGKKSTAWSDSEGTDHAVVAWNADDLAAYLCFLIVCAFLIGLIGSADVGPLAIVP